MNMTQKVDEFCSQFCPFGYRDIERAIEIAEEAGKDIQYAVASVQEFAQSTDTPIDKCDPVYCVYDSLFQEARTEIEQATEKDICNDEPYYRVNISGNYMCTQLDGKDGDMKALHELIGTIEDKSPVVEWLYNKTKI